MACINAAHSHLRGPGGLPTDADVRAFRFMATPKRASHSAVGVPRCSRGFDVFLVLAGKDLGRSARAAFRVSTRWAMTVSAKK
jgi:hypothetical protein